MTFLNALALNDWSSRSSAVASGGQTSGVQQLSRGGHDPLGVRKHQPRGLLHRGAEWDRYWWHRGRCHRVRTVSTTQNKYNWKHIQRNKPQGVAIHVGVKVCFCLQSSSLSDHLRVSASRSVVGVPTCHCLIQLQSGRRYVIAVRAVNVGGPSDRSDVITVKTTGGRSHGSRTEIHFSSNVSFFQFCEKSQVNKNIFLYIYLLMCVRAIEYWGENHVCEFVYDHVLTHFYACVVWSALYIQ